MLKSDDMLLPNAISLNLKYKKAVPCHRLDKETGGLMICSKSRDAEVVIKECFRLKLIKKRYVAIVAGKLEPLQGTISTNVAGKRCITRYEVTKYSRSHQYDWVSTVYLFPVTGRKHQLRRHMQSIGHSIIGDRRYSFADTWPDSSDCTNMFLWAVQLTFPNPAEYFAAQATGKLSHSRISEKDASSMTSTEGSLLSVESVSGIMLPSIDIASAQLPQKSPPVEATTSVDQFVDSEGEEDDLELVVCGEDELLSYPRIQQLYNDIGVSFISAEIDEPHYYAKFRSDHDTAWVLQQQEAAKLGAEPPLDGTENMATALA